ncbi:Ig-like domain repeat protein [Cellulomonas sp.]|uniref:Ig-like domain repeat protein n=1 Tax=Cellulomonas sp. TaxID=40001 RepID=UPI00338E8F7F
MTGAGATPGGTVTVKVGRATVATRTLVDGRLVVTLPPATRTSAVTIRYAGSTSYLPVTASRTLIVR